MDTLARRLRLARQKRGLTQTQLADISGVKQSDISKLEMGKSLTSTKIGSLARALRCDTYWLETGEGQPDWDGQNNVEQGPEVKATVPLISWTTAGHWAEVVDNLQPGDAEEWIATTARVSRTAFALKIKGESMGPKVPDGAIVIFDPERGYTHGSLVLAKRTNDQHATFKQLWYEGEVAYLKPLNDRFPILDMPPDTRIIAVAVRLELDL